MEKVVIIGGVAGGASCGARLRRLKEDIEIIILERGEYISYANCGLPYHISDVIPNRNALLLQTPAIMKKKFNIDVRVKNEVIQIDRNNKVVFVKNIDNQEIYEESYDTLVISTGSSPLRPRIEGIDSSRIHTLWTVPDTDKIRQLVHNDIKKVAVVGGGFIGLEMVENLKHLGLEVTLIEGSNQVMAPFDYEMAQVLHQHIEQSGVSLYLNDTVTSFKETDNSIVVQLQSSTTIDVDLVILSIGVRPNSELAREAGLTLNERGGIVVNSYMKTNDENIYALGDVIEVEDFIFKTRTMIPLAGPANKQGRIVAGNILGKKETYNGSMGTSIAKVFSLSAASTGANEKTLLNKGLIKNKDYHAITIAQNSHASYYPGAMPLTLKLLFNHDGTCIYGAQIVGAKGVDKRIDTLATVIRLKGSIYDLKELELAYAPPYSSAKDPVNMAGFVAENVLNDLTVFSAWNELEINEEGNILDVREDFELQMFALENTKHIPLGELRDRLNELDKEKEYIIFCAAGIRAHTASCILKENGFTKLKVYPGGMRFYQQTHHILASTKCSDCTGTPKQN